MPPLPQPDWDMFQSKHPAAEAHAAARAVSGAAVYVSDYPGNHDFDLLKKLVRALPVHLWFPGHAPATVPLC